MQCYFEFKLRYLKILKLFSIRIKQLLEPIVLQRKAIFERDQSDFTMKDAIFERKIYILLKIDLVNRNVVSGD